MRVFAGALLIILVLISFLPFASPESQKIDSLSAYKKISQRIIEQGVRESSKDDSGRARLIAVFSKDSSEKEISSILQELNAEAEEKLASSTGKVLIISIDEKNIKKLAEKTQLKHIEETGLSPRTYNYDARLITGAEYLQGPLYNLSGRNVVVAQWDSGRADKTHDDLGERIIYNDSSVVKEHSTHVAGTILGNGTINPLYKGMAPNARMVSYEWWYESLEEFSTEYNNSLNYFNSSISQNSWGVFPSEGVNEENCEGFLGSYLAYSSLMDDIVRGSYGKYMVIVWSAGNERLTLADYCGSIGYSYDTIGAYSSGKNIITVGAVNKDKSMSSYSSWGPTNDGRIKPDIVAPGTGIISTIPTNTYVSKQGTSMSAPIVSGIIALMIEKLRDKYLEYSSTSELQVLPSTIKAILLHTAEDLGSPGPDFEYGYGLVNGTAAIDLIANSSSGQQGFLEREYYEGDSLIFETDIFIINKSEFKATLVWDDYPGEPEASKVLVNDFDLSIISPNNTVYYPWVLNNSNYSQPAKTGIDRINNIEQVLVTDPENGTWKIRVNATNITQSPQKYSLVFSTLIVSDIESPVVSLNSPIPYYNSTSQNIVFNCSAIGNITLSNITLYGNWTGSWLANQSISSGLNTTYTFNLTLNDGNYLWNCYACNIAGKCAFHNISRQFLIDSSGPLITLTSPENNTHSNSTFQELNFTVSDFSSNYVNCSLIINNLTNKSLTSLNTSSAHNFSVYLPEGEYNWSIKCEDMWNNSNTSETRVIFIDITPPSTFALDFEAKDILNNGNIFLSWTADSPLYSHKIYRSTASITSVTNSTLIAFLNESFSNFTDNTTIHYAKGNIKYSYAIVSMDKAGNINSSIFSTVNETYANDTVNPESISGIYSENLNNGAVFLNWTGITKDVNNNPELMNNTYIIFRASNIETINTTSISSQLANTTNTSFIDTEIIWSRNYTYVVTTLDDGDNHNYSNSSSNTISITSLGSCLSDYSDWSSCIGNTRTKSRVCYGGGFDNNIQEISESCGASGSSSSSSSSSSSGSSGGGGLPENSQFYEKEQEFNEEIYKVAYQGTSGSEIKLIRISHNSFFVYASKGDEELYSIFNISFVQNITNATVFFRVENEWLENNSLENISIKMLYNQKGLWEELDFKTERTTPKYTYLKASINGDGLIAIVARPKMPLINKLIAAKNITLIPREYGENDTQNKFITDIKHESSKTAKIFIILGLIIIILALFYVYYKKFVLEKSAKKHEKKQKKS